MLSVTFYCHDECCKAKCHMLFTCYAVFHKADCCIFTILLTVVTLSHFFSFFECFNAIIFFIVMLSVGFLLL
jgi:hypothetical protein